MTAPNSQWNLGSYRYLAPAGHPAPVAVKPTDGSVHFIEKALLTALLRFFGGPAIRITFWDGSQLVPDGVEPRAGIGFPDRRSLWRFLRYPGFNFAEDYSRGRIEISGALVTLMEAVLSARVGLNRAPSWRRFVLERLGTLRINTERRARRNIHRHYDIGNDFYKLWLDEQLVYTCAYYPDPHMALEAAQRAKMDLVCRKLALRPGERVLEVGCGWGALACHMARHYGVHVTAYNISHAQILEARARAQAQGLADRVQFVEEDYRNAQGEFDAFVSVGMLEHVGRAHYRALSDVIDRTLKPAGRGLLHSIGQNRTEALNAWIERHIFPGAYPPNLRQIMAVLEPHSFTVLDVENLRLHYARTCEQWMERFEAHAPEVEAMFDVRFVRAWRYYLASSIASFRTDSLELFQVLFTRQGNNAIPWTRACWYGGDMRNGT